MKTYINFYLLLLILLLILWIPVSISKIINFENFRKSILNQPFNISLAHFVIYALPILEILVVIMLLTHNTRLIGLYLSGFLLSVFTGYISLALLNTWQKMPCGCGLIISSLNWKEHLWLNIFFLFINVSCLKLEYKIRKFSKYDSKLQ